MPQHFCIFQSGWSERNNQFYVIAPQSEAQTVIQSTGYNNVLMVIRAVR